MLIYTILAFSRPLPVTRFAMAYPVSPSSPQPPVRVLIEACNDIDAPAPLPEQREERPKL